MVRNRTELIELLKNPLVRTRVCIWKDLSKEIFFLIASLFNAKTN